MKAHIIGGGFGGLAAAAYLIGHAGVPGADIAIYEAAERLGGGFFLGGNAEHGYSLPGAVFDKEFRCTFDLLAGHPLRKRSRDFRQRRILRVQCAPPVSRPGAYHRSRRPHRAPAAVRSEPCATALTSCGWR